MKWPPCGREWRIRHLPGPLEPLTLANSVDRLYMFLPPLVSFYISKYFSISGSLGPWSFLWPPENQPLHNLQGLQVRGVIICQYLQLPFSVDSIPSWFSTAPFSSARSASPPSPGTQTLSLLTSQQHMTCLWRLVQMSCYWQWIVQKKFMLPGILQIAPAQRAPTKTASRQKTSENHWRSQSSGSRV